MPHASPLSRLGLEARSLAVLARAGAVGISSPAKTLEILRSLSGFGPYGAAVHLAAVRHPDSPAITDPRGTISYQELDDQINQLANTFIDKGLKEGHGIAILCRNHRAPLIAGFAASRAGLRSLWLNTSFSPRQAREVCEREGVDVLIYDEEFEDIVAGIEPEQGKFAVSVEGPGPDALDELIASGSPKMPKPPEKPGRIVLLTSGTTGTPKGAPRPDPKGFALPAAVLERMPMRAGETTVMGPPIFHGTGMLIAMITISLGNQLVLRPKFDAAQFVADIAETKATTICVVPVMLQRVLELGDDTLRSHDLSSLKCAFTAGAQLPAKISAAFQDTIGDVIYNLYGSTEVSIATLATPAEVRSAPTSVGRPALGVTIKIFDEKDKEMARGETGRIFVGTTAPFEGYTGGGHKAIVNGLMATGDVGHFDDKGLLYIDGRDDEMIVSGGENVFPREVEELLITMDGVSDVAVLGAEDDDFGQRLRAFLVLDQGASVSEDEVKSFVKDNLARYKVPRDVVFLDELPRNPTGKILKRELADL
ncbi:MAG: AMP-binding protein [Marmoricola sp.]